MNFRKLAGALVALGLVGGATAARAQFGVYGMYQGTRMTGIQCLNTTSNGVNTAVACANGTPGYVAGTTPSTGDLSFTGGFGGVYYDWKNVGPAKLGFDLRAGEEHSNKSATSSAGASNATSNQVVLGGVRASFRTPVRVLRPYAQVSLGWTRSDVTEPFPGTVVQSGNPTPVRPFDNFFTYEGFVGVDLKLFSILDLRLPELGLGNMNRMGTGGQGSTSVGIQSVGMGIVFHLPASY